MFSGVYWWFLHRELLQFKSNATKNALRHNFITNFSHDMLHSNVVQPQTKIYSLILHTRIWASGSGATTLKEEVEFHSLEFIYFTTWSFMGKFIQESTNRQVRFVPESSFFQAPVHGYLDLPIFGQVSIGNSFILAF